MEEEGLECDQPGLVTRSVMASSVTALEPLQMGMSTKKHLVIERQGGRERRIGQGRAGQVTTERRGSSDESRYRRPV